MKIVGIYLDFFIAINITRNYFNSLFVFEDSDNERFRNKRPEVLKMLLRSYGRSISIEVSYKTILNDIKERNASTIDTKTFDSYREALEDLFIIRDLEARSPAIRSKTSIVDTSIAKRLQLLYGGQASLFITAKLRLFSHLIMTLACVAIRKRPSGASIQLGLTDCPF